MQQAGADAMPWETESGRGRSGSGGRSMQQAGAELIRKLSQELEGHGSSPVYMFTGASSGMMPTMPSSCCSWRSLEAQMLVLWPRHR